MTTVNTIELFQKQGGKFLVNNEILLKKINQIKAIIFDWDGVFHSGYKNENQSSSFSEADSMGVNMLRFAYYLKQNKTIPYTAIIIGEHNKTAFYWAKREHLNDVFFKIKDKVEILNWLKEHRNINENEVLFVFDDILDLSMAKACGIRYLINRNSSALLQQFCIENKLCDYISANDGGNHAVREISELTIGILGNWNTVLNERIKFNDAYKPYITQRQTIETKFYTIENGVVVSTEK